MDATLDIGLLSAKMNAKIIHKVYFIECSPPVQSCAECFPCSMSFYPLSNSLKLIAYYPHFVDEGTIAQRG